MLLVLLSQTHYFSLLGFLSCGPPLIRLSCGVQKNPTSQNTGGKKCCAGPHYIKCIALALEGGRWWLKKEQGTERRQKALSLLRYFSFQGQWHWQSSFGALSWKVVNPACESFLWERELWSREVSSKLKLLQGSVGHVFSGSLSDP